MRYAAIDVGTNSCRLLIADIDEDKVVPIYKDMAITRIGEGVSSCGCINSTAMDRTTDCLLLFSKKLNEYEVAKYRAIATSAVRDASNREEFIKLAWQRCQIKIDIVSGEEEASLSYLGVKKSLNTEIAPLVVDLGGGSTEFICEDEVCLSIALGAVRATESNMYALDIDNMLNPLKKIKDNFRLNPLVFVGGTASTMVAIKLGLEIYDSKLVQGQILSRTDLSDLYNLLERMSLGLRRRLPGLQPERADIIPKGALIMLMIMDIFDKPEVIISDSDLLEGIIHTIYETST